MSAEELPTKPPKPTQQPPTPPDKFLDAIAHRHSIYKLTNTSPLSPVALQSLLRQTVLTVPSAFNTQSTRVVLLLHTSHTQFWTDIVTNSILSSAYMQAEAAKDPDKPTRTRSRFESFANAYGTVLFFESEDKIQKLLGMAAQYGEPTVREWSGHTSGMHQLTVWTAFEAAGLGANLQHYNYEPETSRRTLEWLGLPADWDLKAQLVFGGVQDGGWPEQAKEKDDPAGSVRVFGA